MEVQILDAPPAQAMDVGQYRKRTSPDEELRGAAMSYSSGKLSVRKQIRPSTRADRSLLSPDMRTLQHQSLTQRRFSGNSSWSKSEHGSSLSNPIDVSEDDEEAIDSLIQRFSATCETRFEPKDNISTSLRSSVSLEVEEIYPVYKPGTSLLLRDGSYLRVEATSRSLAGVIYHGRYLVAMSDAHLERFIPKFPGELIWIVHNTMPISQDQVRRSVKVQFTNIRAASQKNKPTQMICRLKLTIKTKLTAPMDEREPPNTKEEYSVEYLNFNEADSGFRLSSSTLRSQWRGTTVPFGEAELPPNLRAQQIGTSTVIDLTDSATRTYTFGDSFCGAGGVSHGARKAEFSIRWAFDSSPAAIETYQHNFPGAVVENATIYDFLTNNDSFLRVDVCHGSPPCQPFSPAHTVNCERDEANSACIFSCHDLLLRARPRILTIEETHGLVNRHGHIFHRMILDLVECGYSVRWAVLDCLDYGVPQSRKRLVIIAAGPGETLPRLPPATHGLPGSGLLPHTTIHSAIHDIPEDASDHDPTAAEERYRLLGYRTPYLEHTSARTITCGGGEWNYHPSGRRKFTTREFACLQTFPVDFEFSGRQTRRQIGNAVPPVFAAAIYREIHRSLRETDEKESQG